MDTVCVRVRACVCVSVCNYFCIFKCQRNRFTLVPKAEGYRTQPNSTRHPAFHYLYLPLLSFSHSLSHTLFLSSGLRPHAENVGRNEICGQRVLIDCKYLHSRRRVYIYHVIHTWTHKHTHWHYSNWLPCKRVLKAFCHSLKLEQVLRGDQWKNISN